jgi:hypothetical protein
MVEYIDTIEVQSPGWWLKRLHDALCKRRLRLEQFDAYYEGHHRLAFATEKFREAFKGLFETLSDNWCGLVVDAVEERLDIQGFRLDPESTKSDDEAWRIWQENQMDAESQIGHIESFVNGCSYVMVAPPNHTDSAILTVEHPFQVITEDAPGFRGRAAALKEWLDDWTGLLMATLYLPDQIYKFQSLTAYRNMDDVSALSKPRWVWREGESEGGDQNPLGMVPVVPLYNKPRLVTRFDSEIRQVMPIQNAVNKLVADMMVASEYQSFLQRWATGIEVPVDPDTNQPVETWKKAIDRIWTTENPDAKFGNFDTVDLRRFVEAIQMLIQHIASQTRTPPHYFFLRGEFPSGESIVAAEAGLVKKAARRMRHFGEAWEEILRLAFIAQGQEDKAKRAIVAETIWADAESRSEAQHMDAVVKMQSIGVPQEALWEQAGFSQTEIKQFKKMIKENPPPPSGAGGGEGNGQVPVGSVAEEG